MNTLTAKLAEIISQGEVSYLVFDASAKKLACFVVETPQTNPELVIGAEVDLVFKETQVSLGLDIDSARVSISNVFSGKVVSVDKGKILSMVDVESDGLQISSLISTRSFERMDIKVGLEINALVKATDVSILWKAEVEYERT